MFNSMKVCIRKIIISIRDFLFPQYYVEVQLKLQEGWLYIKIKVYNTHTHIGTSTIFDMPKNDYDRYLLM